ncbi:MAG: chorismate-binding protein [Parachlamydiaceae bacterium]|nr:chorismate-binding protein [Parachlamydiaceae bacterium]
MEFDYNSFIKSGAIISIDENKVLLGWGKSFWKHHKELDSKIPAFYFPDFFLYSTKPWIQYEFFLEISKENLKTYFQKNNEVGACLIWENPYKKLFYNAFEQLQFEFSHSRLSKAVPYVFLNSKSQFLIDRLQHTLQSALNYSIRYPLVYLYGFWNEHSGMMGVTPELLFEYNENSKNSILQTVALAGTCANKGQDIKAFQRDPKQLREHVFAVDGIKQSLMRFGKIKQEKMQVLELQTLSHLMTPIQVELDDKVDFTTIIHALHPTPALGAYPRIEGWEWLKEYNSQIDRGRYGAPAGILYPGQSKARCLVAIRNVQWELNEIRIGVGCGVIQESQCDQEWSEICLKIHAIQEILSL